MVVYLCPSSLEDLLQKFGRCVRNGEEDGEAILCAQSTLYKWKKKRSEDNTCKAKDNKATRKTKALPKNKGKAKATVPTRSDASSSRPLKRSATQVEAEDAEIEITEDTARNTQEANDQGEQNERTAQRAVPPVEQDGDSSEDEEMAREIDMEPVKKVEPAMRRWLDAPCRRVVQNGRFGNPPAQRGKQASLHI